MHSTASASSPRLNTTRSCWIRHVPGLASLASLASSVSHDSCMAMRSGAVRCNSDETAMTHARAAGGRGDATGCFAATSPTFAHVAFLSPRCNQRPTFAARPTRANVTHTGLPPGLGSFPAIPQY